MNREILFKAKRIDNGEWVEGTGIVKIEQNTYHNGRYAMVIGGVNFDELDSWYPSSYSTEIDPDTLCQYTGLNDKNSKKIFEGDICLLLNINNDPEMGLYTEEFEVIYRDGSFRCLFKTDGEEMFIDEYFDYECDLAVTGNIHDKGV